MAEKRLIEHTLPVKALSREPAREKAIRHGHISTLHVWLGSGSLGACGVGAGSSRTFAG